MGMRFTPYIIYREDWTLGQKQLIRSSLNTERDWDFFCEETPVHIVRSRTLRWIRALPESFFFRIRLSQHKPPIRNQTCQMMNQSWIAPLMRYRHQLQLPIQRILNLSPNMQMTFMLRPQCPMLRQDLFIYARQSSAPHMMLRDCHQMIPHSRRTIPWSVRLKPSSR